MVDRAAIPCLVSGFTFSRDEGGTGLGPLQQHQRILVSSSPLVIRCILFILSAGQLKVKVLARSLLKQREEIYGGRISLIVCKRELGG